MLKFSSQCTSCVIAAVEASHHGDSAKMRSQCHALDYVKSLIRVWNQIACKTIFTFVIELNKTQMYCSRVEPGYSLSQVVGGMVIEKAFTGSSLDKRKAVCLSGSE